METLLELKDRLISLRAGVVTCSSVRVDEWWDYARVTGGTPEDVSASRFA